MTKNARIGKGKPSFVSEIPPASTLAVPHVATVWPRFDPGTVIGAATGLVRSKWTSASNWAEHIALNQFTRVPWDGR